MDNGSSGELVLRGSLRDPFDRDIPAGIVHITLRGRALAALNNDTGRARALLQASWTTVEVNAQPPAEHEVSSVRYAGTPAVAAPTGESCPTVAATGIGGACFAIAPRASVVAIRIEHDIPTGNGTRVMIRGENGQVFLDRTWACGISPLILLPFFAASVIVQPVAYTGCLTPSPSGTVSADFTIPPP